MTDVAYDSRPETYKHIGVVRHYLGKVIKALLDRADGHDASKLEDPERAIFDEYTSKLRRTTYGSDEYKSFLEGMGEALQHHYSVNQHHPEWGEREIEWKPVVGFEGHYEVSNLGDVRSVTRQIARKDGLTRQAEGQPMVAHLNADGYPRLQLSRDGRKTNVFVHGLVAEAFVPNPDGKPEVNHKNGNKLNNHASNLEWSTRCENNQHAHDTGLNPSPAKWVIYCAEHDLTTLGANAMEKALRERGIETFASGIYRAATKGGEHKGLTFESMLLVEWRRSRLEGMTLIDLVEMICDWTAATKRHDDGDIRRSIEVNQERFGYDDQIKQILLNTVEALGE